MDLSSVRGWKFTIFIPVPMCSVYLDSSLSVTTNPDSLVSRLAIRDNRNVPDSVVGWPTTSNRTINLIYEPKTNRTIGKALLPAPYAAMRRCVRHGGA